MTVATVSTDGHPSTRTVLLKGVENGRFIFFTNYESRKGRQLTANPYISLSFVWHKLERQIHIEGKAEDALLPILTPILQAGLTKSKIRADFTPKSRHRQPYGDNARVRPRSGNMDRESIKRPDNWEVCRHLSVLNSGRTGKQATRPFPLFPTNGWQLEKGGWLLNTDRETLLITNKS